MTPKRRTRKRLLFRTQMVATILGRSTEWLRDAQYNGWFFYEDGTPIEPFRKPMMTKAAGEIPGTRLFNLDEIEGLAYSAFRNSDRYYQDRLDQALAIIEALRARDNQLSW